MNPKSTYFGAPGDTKITKNAKKLPLEKHLENKCEKYPKIAKTETCLSMGTGSAFKLEILEVCCHTCSIHNPYILSTCSLHESCLVPEMFL